MAPNILEMDSKLRRHMSEKGMRAFAGETHLSIHERNKIIAERMRFQDKLYYRRARNNKLTTEWIQYANKRGL
ncbi:MAG TPA: hypothetical protein VHE53_02840 [Patescibacteria group bacterium]|nr:hypothetical protein [Patescibacteria group bacterium]